MTLSEYLEDKGRGALSKLVRDSGLSHPTVVSAIRGEHWVHDKTRKALSDATGGAVPPEKVGRCW